MARRNRKVQVRYERRVRRVRTVSPWFETDGQCLTGKLRFGTEAAADRALAVARAERARRGDAKVEKRHYGCGWCHGFHLTSQESTGAWAQDAITA
jgi:hypothetical protein